MPSEKSKVLSENGNITLKEYTLGTPYTFPIHPANFSHPETFTGVTKTMENTSL